MRGKNLLTYTSYKFRKGDIKILQTIRITSGPSARISKWNQFSQFKWTSTKGSREAASEGLTYTIWWNIIIQKQPPRGALSKRCSVNMQQVYRRIPMPKCDFNTVANTSRWLLLIILDEIVFLRFLRINSDFLPDVETRFLRIKSKIYWNLN